MGLFCVQQEEIHQKSPKQQFSAQLCGVCVGAFVQDSLTGKPHTRHSFI